jgi:hypothetical protein
MATTRFVNKAQLRTRVVATLSAAALAGCVALSLTQPDPLGGIIVGVTPLTVLLIAAWARWSYIELEQRGAFWIVRTGIGPLVRERSLGHLTYVGPRSFYSETRMRMPFQPLGRVVDVTNDCGQTFVLGVLDGDEATQLRMVAVLQSPPEAGVDGPPPLEVPVARVRR